MRWGLQWEDCLKFLQENNVNTADLVNILINQKNTL